MQRIYITKNAKNIHNQFLEFFWDTLCIIGGSGIQGVIEAWRILEARSSPDFE